MRQTAKASTCFALLFCVWIQGSSSYVSRWSHATTRYSNSRSAVGSVHPLHALPPLELISAESGDAIKTTLEESSVRISFMLSGSGMIAAEPESWRQYVPLVVSCFVILDILLGSPFANSVLGLIQQSEKKEEKEDEGDQPVEGWTPSWEQQKKRKRESPRARSERIDTKAMADAAIYKAQSTLELRNFLDARKTDYDRMEVSYFLSRVLQK
jgi:hypothetical protein